MQGRDEILYKLSNCSLYKHIHDSYDGLHTHYTFKISLDLNNINIINYLIEENASSRHHKYIKFTYMNEEITCYITGYNIENNTIIYGWKEFNINIISNCVIHYELSEYISNNLKSDEYDYNKRHYESNDTKIINNKKKYIKQPNNDNIDFID